MRFENESSIFCPFPSSKKARTITRKQAMSTSVFTADDLKDQSGSSGKVSLSFEGNVAIVSFQCGDNRLNVDFITKVHAALDKVQR